GRRRTPVPGPAPRIGRRIRTGFLTSRLIRAVTPHRSWSTSAQAMTSSRIVATIPPWAIPSQPSNRRSSVVSVQQRSPAAWSSRWRPWALSEPQAKQWWGVMTIRLPPIRTSSSVSDGSDVKVPNLAGLGLDEVLARLDPLAHEHREDRIGLARVLDLDLEQRPRLRVHRGLPELVGVHLAEALEPLHAHVLGRE